jgi:ribosomal protein S13
LLYFVALTGLLPNVHQLLLLSLLLSNRLLPNVHQLLLLSLLLSNSLFTQSSGSGETNTTNVVGNEARNIVTGTNASVTINENHRIQSMTPQSKAVVEKLTKIEGMENRLSKTVLSAVKKVNDQSLDKLKKTTELALNRHLDEQQVIVKIADATNEYGVYVLDSDTNVYRPLGKVIQTLVRTDPDSPPEGDETFVSPNVATPTEGDETTAGSSEAEPSTEGDETTAGSSSPNTGDTNEVDAGLMFEDKSGVKDDLPPSANEQSSSEVRPYRKRIIDPTNGVG